MEAIESGPYRPDPLPILSPAMYARAQANVPQRDGESDREWWNRTMAHAVETLGPDECERLLADMYPYGLT